MVSPHHEKLFFHFILSSPNYIEVTHYRFFDDPIIRQTYPVVKQFYEKYREIPSLTQMLELRKTVLTDVSVPQLETLWTIDMGEFDEKWVRENAETFIQYKTLDLSVIDTVNYMKTTPVSPENVREVVDKAKDIILKRNNIDFDFNEGSDFFDAESHVQRTIDTFSTGFNFIDKVSDGGFSAGTLTVFLGQPKVGKSLWLANMAAQSMRQGYNVAIVTLEMAEHKYIKRLGANLLGIRMDDYKAKSVDREYIKHKLRDLNANNSAEYFKIPGKLFVKSFPTGTASAHDIEGYLQRVQERKGIKFKVVIIDYLNIMKNWRNPNAEDTYMKIKQIAEDTRAVGQRNNWAMVSATQTKQAAFDESDMSMNAVAESSALVATVDLLYAIIQTPAMYVNKQYKLKVLANRDDGYKNFIKLYDIDYPYMKLTESSEIEYDGGDGMARKFYKK